MAGQPDDALGSSEQRVGEHPGLRRPDPDLGEPAHGRRGGVGREERPVHGTDAGPHDEVGTDAVAQERRQHADLAGAEDPAAPEHEGHRPGLRCHDPRLVVAGTRRPAEPPGPASAPNAGELRSLVCRDIPSGRPDPTRHSATTPGRRPGSAGSRRFPAAPRWSPSSRSVRTSWSWNGWNRPARREGRRRPSVGRWRRPTRPAHPHTGARLRAGVGTAGWDPSASCSPCR